MPSYDISQAKAELLAASEPIELKFRGKVYVFPGAMPAEFEIEQMALQRETAELPEGAEAPGGAEERLMRAAFGEHYAELIRSVPPTELALGLGLLVADWMAAYQDPNLPARLTELLRSKNAAGANSKPPSSTTGPSLRPTSSASTGSISRRPSSAAASNGSPGGGSARSTAGSAARP